LNSSSAACRRPASSTITNRQGWFIAFFLLCFPLLFPAIAARMMENEQFRQLAELPRNT
jgi:hypothetical protein